MKNTQSTQTSMLRKLGCLLLCGSMLATSFAALTACKSTVTPAATTTAVSDEQPAAPEIDHLVEQGNGSYSLISPNGTLSFNISTASGFTYSVSRTDDKGASTEWVRPSYMGVEIDRVPYYQAGVTVSEPTLTEINRTFAHMGNQSSITDHCYEAVFTVQQGDYTYYLDARAYDNGIAFRYRLPASTATATRMLTKEFTTYNLRTDIAQSWYGVENQDYEAVIESHDPNEVTGGRITAPLTATIQAKKGYISIMEGALTETYSGVNLKALGGCSYGTTFYVERSEDAIAGDMVSGWRLVNVADDLNELVNNYNIYCVNEPADEELFADTSWIVPGRSAWSWNVDYQGPKYEQMLDYTRIAAELGYEYNIIDEGWHEWADYKNKLADIGALGDQYNVNQILWAGVTRNSSRPDATPNEERVDQLLQLIEDTHLDGSKMDFWWSEYYTKTTDLQKYTLTESAKRQLVVNFHGCNKNTGLNTTFPNEVTREAVRGQENVGNSNNTNFTTQAEWLNKQLYTRFLCGHADWTPATHTAMQIASVILIDSPFMTISTDPTLVLNSPAVEFIKSIPTVWDKTVVLSDSSIGSYSVYAKQKDGVWFVGGIASSTQPTAKVDLSEFITDDGTYVAEIWTGGKGSLESKTINVTKNDVIEIGVLEKATGFAIRLTKLSLSQYGGKINGAITVTAPSGATVKYTVDGSDPRTSDTATACNGSITLNESCRLKVAIVDGDGKGTLLSYQFNKMD